MFIVLAPGPVLKDKLFRIYGEMAVGMEKLSQQYFDCDDFSVSRACLYMYTYYGEMHFSVVTFISPMITQKNGLW